MFEAVIELSGVSEICRSVHTLFKTQVSKLISGGKNQRLFHLMGSLLRKKKGVSWYQMEEKSLVLLRFFSVCVCSRVEAVVQPGLMTPLRFKLSNMLSLIRMCGGVGVGVQRPVKPQLTDSSLCSSLGFCLLVFLFSLPLLSFLNLHVSTLQFIQPLFNQIHKFKYFF